METTCSFYQTQISRGFAVSQEYDKIVTDGLWLICIHTFVCHDLRIDTLVCGTGLKPDSDTTSCHKPVVHTTTRFALDMPQQGGACTNSRKFCRVITCERTCLQQLPKSVQQNPGVTDRSAYHHSNLCHPSLIVSYL